MTTTQENENLNINDNNAVILAEYRVLNKLINDEITEFNSAYLVHPKAVSMYNAIVYLKENNLEISKSSISTEMSKYGISVASDILDQVINNKDEDNIEDAKKLLRSVYTSNSAVREIQDVENVLLSNIDITDDIKYSLQAKLQNIQQLLEPEDSQGAINLNKWFTNYEKDYKKRIDGKIYWFNDPVIDSLILDGPVPDNCGLVVASPGMGKSSFMLHIVNKLIDSGIPCMYFSLEMGSTATMDRLISSRLHIPYKDIVNPSNEDVYYTIYNKIIEERKKLEDNKLFKFSENPVVTLSSLESEIRKFQMSLHNKYAIIIIDLLTMLKDFESSANLATVIEMGMNKLNAIAKRCHVHILGTAQLNRTAEQTRISDIESMDDALRISRSSIKNSAGLLERCRYVLSLYRRKFYLKQYFPDQPETELEEDIVKVSVLKQNNGPCESGEFLFDPEEFSLYGLANNFEKEDENS